MRTHVLSTLSVVLLAGDLAVPATGQWVEPPGMGWLDVQIAHQRTRTGFNKDGNVVALEELDPDARSIITTVRLSGALGLIRGVDVWGDLPIHRQEFNGAGSDLFGARIPVHGQSTRSQRLPAGPTFILGHFVSWSDPLW